tara:strand:+ start:503 stop:1294 length:792 start_codon:yes stop_codon:yes gene_type:complete
MQIQTIAEEVFEAARSVTQIEPFSNRGIHFSQAEAYAVAQKVADMRGGKILGRKIGFTNRLIWPIYDVHEPMWATMTNETVEYTETNLAVVSLSKFCEPRIEPEIVIGFSKAPPPRATLEEIAGCVGWIAAGFEIVDSIYPNWGFSLGDTIAAGGLHGKLVVGHKRVPPQDLIQRLNDVKVILSLDGKINERGQGSNVLDGPISALHYLQHGIAQYDIEADLKSGDIVTTGTLTDAKPISPGQLWSANFEGLETMPLEVTFTK